MDSDRDTPGENKWLGDPPVMPGESLLSLRRSSLLRPASESRLRPLLGSRGPQLSDMESSDEASEKEPEEGTRWRREEAE